MDLHLALHQVAEAHHLSSEQSEQLYALADKQQEPPAVARALPFGVAILGAILCGFGVIMWIAANWESLGRAGRFALLESLIVVTCVGALLRPAARAPLSVMAVLSIGGLLAYFGQTYQTGADPWQLFAWWSLLALPICAGVRHEALWTTWALVTMSAISLWLRATVGHDWQRTAPQMPAHVAAWTAALLLVVALHPAFRHLTGAGPVSTRLALTLAAILVTFPSIAAVFSGDLDPLFWVGLAVVTAAAWAFTLARFYDTFSLSVLGLSLNILLVGLIARLVGQALTSSNIFGLLLIGLCAAGLLTATVRFILSLARRRAGEGARHAQ